MKKIRKHFMILFLFLLFGATVLSLSSNGVFASAFGWLQSTPSTKSALSSQAAASKTASTQEAALQADLQDADNLFLSPIDAAGGSIKHTDFIDESDTSTTGDADSGGGYSSPLTGTAYRSGSEHSATGSADIPATITPSGPANNTPGNNGATTDPIAPGPGDSPSNTEPPAPSASNPSGGNTTPGGTGSNGSHSGGGHHSSSVSITGVTLDKTELDLAKGESATLTATIAPSNTTQDKTITWSSSDPAAANVDDTGKVTAIEGGAATITATTSNGKTATCSVTVSVPATGISLSLSDTPVERGQTLKLTAKLTPEDSTEKVLWATSDSDIASVDSTGNITGVSPGTAVIIATVGDGSISASCRVTTVVSVSQLVLSDEKLTIKKGESHQLTAQVLPEDTTEDTTVTWSSSDPDVATVDDAGNITAVEGGTAIITVQTGTHSAQCTVTVLVPVTGITLDRTELTLARGTTEILSPIIAPADATDKAVDWTSSDETVATVDEDGTVTAVSAGQAVITVKALDGGFTAHCKITVNVPIANITLDKDAITLMKGENTFLSATIEPVDTTQDKTITWTTSDSHVATVDETGKVTAVGGGSAVITATSSNGKAATCQATILVPVTGVSLNHSSLQIQKGTSQSLLAQISPSDATDKDVLWTSSNPAVATVDENGNISAVSVGNAIITATTIDGGFQAQCTVSVVCRVTGISISAEEINLARGSSTQVSAVITPTDATDRAITWSTSNSSVASVDANGRITGIAEGTATITAISHDGNYTAQCIVHVYVQVNNISLYRTSFHILEGSNYSLLSAITPTDATNNSIVWSSSNPAVATVDANGKVTALRSGSTSITAKAVNSSAQASCAVYVVNTVHFTAIETSRHESSSSGGDYDKAMIGTPTGTIVSLDSKASCDTTWNGNSGTTSYSNDIASIQFNLDAIVSIDQIHLAEWSRSWLSSSWSDESYARISDTKGSSKGSYCDRKSDLSFSADGGVDTIRFTADLDTNKDDGSGSVHTYLNWTNMTFNNGAVTPIYDGFIS